MNPDDESITRQIVELEILLEVRRRMAAKKLQPAVDRISDAIFRFNDVGKGLRTRSQWPILGVKEVSVMSLVTKAREFAEKAHAGNFRMGTGEPYFNHVERVAATLAALGFHRYVIAAAYLHDVIEDTAYSEADLAKEFGPEVANLVAEVTNPVLPKEPGNRPWRKAKEVEHLAKASYFGASIKLADMLDNSSNVREVDPEFAATYLPVLAAKLAVLGHGHPELLAKVTANLAKS